MDDANLHQPQKIRVLASKTASMKVAKMLASKGPRFNHSCMGPLVPRLVVFIAWNRLELLGTLENTIEVKQRMDAFGAELRPVDIANITEQL